MTTLRELYVSYNPWSCDTTTLHVLQMELIALADKNSHLNNFDGGKMECFDPPNMKGKKPLHSAHSKNKKTPDELNKKRILYENMKKRRRMSQGLPASQSNSASSSDEEATVKPANNKKIPDELSKKSILKENMKKRRRMSQGLPASQSNSASNSDDEARVKPANKKTPDELSKKSILMKNMKKWHRMSHGLQASQSQSAPSSDGEATVTPANNKKTPDKLESETVLIDSMKKRRRMSQGLPTTDVKGESNSENEAEVNSMCNLEERMSRQRRQSCGFAEGENSSFSEEDSGFTPQ
ncbi:uncharacterized protein [Porites lutea]|uniref:uncharacterized protein n=1 Tax=Porites lutea TaxID=51062 RepID=UPI003CC69001